MEVLWFLFLAVSMAWAAMMPPPQMGPAPPQPPLPKYPPPPPPKYPPPPSYPRPTPKAGSAYQQYGGGPSKQGDEDVSHKSLGGGYRPPDKYKVDIGQPSLIEAPKPLDLHPAKEIKYEVTTPTYSTRPYVPPKEEKLPDYKPYFDEYKPTETPLEVEHGMPYREKKEYEVNLVDYTHYFPIYTTTTTTTSTTTTTTYTTTTTTTTATTTTTTTTTTTYTTTTTTTSTTTYTTERPASPEPHIYVTPQYTEKKYSYERKVYPQQMPYKPEETTTTTTTTYSPLYYSSQPAYYNYAQPKAPAYVPAPPTQYPSYKKDYKPPDYKPTPKY